MRSFFSWALTKKKEKDFKSLKNVVDYLSGASAVYYEMILLYSGHHSIEAINIDM